MVRTSNQDHPSDWRAIGESVAGSSHNRQGIPKQDAICWWPDTGVGLPLILAVSDGHGSEAHFRSDTGARFAVDAAIQILARFSEVSGTSKSPDIMPQNVEQHIARRVHRRWLDLVADDVYHHPISYEELAKLEMSKGVARVRQVVLQPALAYGATLLCALVTHSSILYLQLGDGDILAVGDDATTVKRPIPRDDELVGDETTSLCMPDAWRRFKTASTPLSDDCPALIVMCTDGYANSFVDDSAFLEVGPDYLKLIRGNGPDFVESNLQRWLSAASEGGSGDDVSVGLIFRPEIDVKVDDTHSDEAEQALGLEPQSDPPKHSVGSTPDSTSQDDVPKTDNSSVRDERKA